MRKSLILVFILFLSTFGFATDYYIKNGGNDGLSGLDDTNAWETISKVNSTSFSATDTINFKRGSTWSGTRLTCDNSGTDAENMVTYQAYDSGVLPILENAPGNEHVIWISADWVKIRYLQLQDAYHDGVYVAPGADNNIIEYCELTYLGTGVQVLGANTLIQYNYIHDLKMVVNTESPGDDDFGAMGVLFKNGSSNSEVCYNTFENCRAESFDYGYDGKVVEFFLSATVSNVKVHHNWSTGCQGFLETGGSGGTGLVQDLEIYYNIGCENYGENSFSFHTSGGFLVDHDNIQIYNNTWVDTRDYASPKYSFISFGSGTVASDFLFRNNIFYIDDWSFICHSDSQGWNWTHEYNCYYRGSAPTALGFTMDTGEITQDPKFVNVSGEDYHLESDSPCIEAGTDLSLTPDYDGIVIPQGNIADIGAFEYVFGVLGVGMKPGGKIILKPGAKLIRK